MAIDNLEFDPAPTDLSVTFNQIVAGKADVTVQRGEVALNDMRSSAVPPAHHCLQPVAML